MVVPLPRASRGAARPRHEILPLFLTLRGAWRDRLLRACVSVSGVRRR